MQALRLVVGLGNPGPRYAGTRHNAGFRFVDALASQSGVGFSADARLQGELARLDRDGSDLRILKPMTYMNHSGRSVAAVLHYFRLPAETMLVVHDDLDLPPGVARLKFDGGHGGQNGLRDIVGQLGHGRFHRLRIGIGHPGRRDLVTPWVLGRATAQDQQCIDEAIAAALAVFPLLARGDSSAAMQQLHAPRPQGARDGGPA